MECGIFGCPVKWRASLPPQTRRVRFVPGLFHREWEVLALTHSGCRRLWGSEIRCRLLLVPGDAAEEALRHVRAETVITCGLSQRDSLTLSSLETPMLCVQRQLPRPEGGTVEPQEIPLPTPLHEPEELLPIFGLKLLLMPLK